MKPSIVLSFKELESTNSKLKQLAQEKPLTDFTVVDCWAQTGGRGQMGKIWKSREGKNVHFSIFSHGKQHRVSDAMRILKQASIALYEAISSIVGDSDLSIKWPNDILYRGNKICGILIENNVSGKVISSSVIGVGLNVNEAPTLSKGERVTCSLKDIISKELDISAVKKLLWSSLIHQLQRTDFDLLDEEYFAVLWGSSEAVSVQMPDKNILDVVIQEIMDDGRVILNFGGLELGPYGFGQIKFL